MKQLAFLTLADRGNFMIDDELAVAPLAELGWEVSTLPWQQSDRPWADFDAVIIRSTWDYWENAPAFLSALERIGEQTRLANPLELVKWNIEKTYLRSLAEDSGVPVVPTLWPDSLRPGSIESLQDQLDSKDIVVKPIVGGNGAQVVRISPDKSREYRQHVVDWYKDTPCMVQPFMPRILIEGEYSMFFFNGEYSHAISKVPAKGEFRSQEERGADIRMCGPGDRLLKSAVNAIGAIEPTPLYARVDLVRGQDGEMLVMELELIEPSMYLRTSFDAAARFAAAIDHWVSHA